MERAGTVSHDADDVTGEDPKLGQRRTTGGGILDLIQLGGTRVNGRSGARKKTPDGRNKFEKNKMARVTVLLMMVDDGRGDKVDTLRWGGEVKKVGRRKRRGRRKRIG